jgi:hypothetical protein
VSRADEAWPARSALRRMLARLRWPEQTLRRAFLPVRPYVGRMVKKLKLQERRAVIPSPRSLAACRPLEFLGAIKGAHRGSVGPNGCPIQNSESQRNPGVSSAFRVLSRDRSELHAHVENPIVIAAATETPRGERSHAVGAHVAEGHGGFAFSSYGRAKS